MAKNKVIAGDYLNCSVLKISELISINSGFKKILELNQNTVENYELITEEHRKSAISGVSRGLVGGVLLGPVGLLAGLSAKNKGTHFVAIEFKDGKKSLLEIDDKIYKTLIQKMFKTSNTPTTEQGSFSPVDINIGRNNIDNNLYNAPPKKKGCFPVGCWTVIILAIIITIIVGTNQSSDKEDAKSSVPVIIDATKFSNINSAQLIEILGEPESVEDFKWSMPKNNQSIVGKLYIYEKNKYEFILFDDVVVRLNVYSGQYMGYDNSTMNFDKEEDILPMFGIVHRSTMQKVADTNYALRYEKVSDKVEGVWILEIKNNTFGIAKFTYDSKYF